MTLQKILLIEDEPDIQEITRSALELVGGFEVYAASGGLEGIALAEQEQPDLILLDMMMPGLNGAEPSICSSITPRLKRSLSSL